MTEIIGHTFHPEDKQAKIKNLVHVMVGKAEHGESLDRELEHLFRLSGHRAIETDFADYHSYTTLEDLVRRYLIKPVPNGVKLDKEQIVQLLTLYHDNMDDEAVMEYYLDYLEQNLPVSAMDTIFHESDTDDINLLAEMLLNAPEEKTVNLDG